MDPALALVLIWALIIGLAAAWDAMHSTIRRKARQRYRPGP